MTSKAPRKPSQRAAGLTLEILDGGRQVHLVLIKSAPSSECLCQYMLECLGDIACKLAVEGGRRDQTDRRCAGGLSRVERWSGLAVPALLLAGLKLL